MTLSILTTFALVISMTTRVSAFLWLSLRPDRCCVIWELYKVALKTGSKFLPQNSPIMQFETTLTQSQTLAKHGHLV